MTTKEKLILMEEIKRKNDAAWSKYAKQSRPGWTWDMDVRHHRFDREGFAVTLTICFPLLLALIVIMA